MQPRGPLCLMHHLMLDYTKVVLLPRTALKAESQPNVEPERPEYLFSSLTCKGRTEKNTLGPSPIEFPSFIVRDRVLADAERS